MREQKTTVGRCSGGRALRRWLPVALTAVCGLHSGAALAQQATLECRPMQVGGPLFITPDCRDPQLDTPYVDDDRPGSVTDPATGVTVSYRYVHGGFKGSKTRFALYFPAPVAYRGWFIEHTYPTVTTEGAEPSVVAFAISNGAYVVSTNNNGGVQTGGALSPYRANAAASRFSRIEAQRIYGDGKRPRGFIFGASGGAYQTLGAAENTRGVWDGSVPMVPGVPNAIPSFQVVQLYGLRALAPVLPRIADAEAVGGSGDPFAGLTGEQRAALTEVSRMGFPLRGWWQYASMRGGSFVAVETPVRLIDRTYADDFWSTPGYEGALPALQALRIKADVTVKALDGAGALVLADVPKGDLLDADLKVASGPQAGKVLKIGSVQGDVVRFARSNGALASFSTGQTNDGITPGTKVELDNSWLLALQYYQRHQVPDPDQYGWNQYRDAQGRPVPPQRPRLIGPLLDANTSGAVATGRFNGKMIMLGSAMDTEAYPWSLDWYRTKARAAFGERLGQAYRIWYMDNCDHVPTGPASKTDPHAADHIVSYTGEAEQALLYLNDWVARGAPPPGDSRYRIDELTQVRLPPTAAERGGVQPVVTLTASGVQAGAVEVKAGETVAFSVAAEMPRGAGDIVAMAWDLHGTGAFSPMQPVAHAASLRLDRREAYARPGTYFATVEVISARPGAGPSPAYGLVRNIASVRVVVR